MYLKFDHTKQDGNNENNMHLREHFEDWPKVMTVLTTWESIGWHHRGDMDFMHSMISFWCF